MTRKPEKSPSKPKIDKETDAQLRQAAGLLIDSFLAIDSINDDEHEI